MVAGGRGWPVGPGVDTQGYPGCRRPLQARDSFPSMHRLRKDERSVGTEKEGDSGQDTGPGGTAL